MWYFRPSVWLPLKLILLAGLVWCFLFYAFNSGLRALVVVKLVFALAASFHLLLTLIVWPLGLFLALSMLAPVGVPVSQSFMFPHLWVDGGLSRFAKLLVTGAVLIAGYLLALAAAWITTQVVMWLADMNPCVSWRVGVTGSVPPPSDCR